MKKMWPAMVMALAMVIVCMFQVAPAYAADQCDVVGHTYTVYQDNAPWVLTDFVESAPAFSPTPPCAGTVMLLSPTGDYLMLDWISARDHLVIGGFPAVLTTSGLKLYAVPTGLHSVQIGNTTYLLDQEVPVFLFK